MPRFQLRPLPNFSSLIRGHFFAGLLVVIPLVVIAWILTGAVTTLWGLQRLLPTAWQPNALFAAEPGFAFLLNAAFTVGLAIVLALGISFLGWVSKQYLGQKLLELIALLIQRIPVIRSIYSALDQLLRTMASGGGRQFSRVVYVEYPRKGVWAIAFVTGPARGPAVPAGHLNVYVPPTPNPTSGFHLIVPEAEVRDSQMAVEEAFRTLLSLGIAQPTSQPAGTTHVR